MSAYNNQAWTKKMSFKVFFFISIDIIWHEYNYWNNLLGKNHLDTFGNNVRA